MSDCPSSYVWQKLVNLIILLVIRLMLQFTHSLFGHATQPLHMRVLYRLPHLTAFLQTVHNSLILQPCLPQSYFVLSADLPWPTSTQLQQTVRVRTNIANCVCVRAYAGTCHKEADYHIQITIALMVSIGYITM